MVSVFALLRPRLCAAALSLLLLGSTPVQADVQLPKIFGDHMVLQQERDNLPVKWVRTPSP